MKRFLLALQLFLALSLAASQLAANTMALSELDLEYVEHLRSRIAPPPVAGRTADGAEIQIAGQKFAGGFGVRGITRSEIQLDGRATEFHAWLGVTDDSEVPGPVWFEVIGDGRMLFEGPEMKCGDHAVETKVPLTGVKHLILTVQSSDAFTFSTAWADATLSYEGAKPVSIRHAAEKPVVLTPPASPAPRINGADVFGAHPGNPVLYRVAASGVRPMTFSAEDLPTGLALDEKTGRITGKIAKAGTYPVKITAKNTSGEASRVIKFVIGPRLALTPPMGWNSWYCFGEDVTAQDLHAAAAAMAASGLDQYGFSYVNIDDFWMTRPPLAHPVWKELEKKSDALGFKLFPLRLPASDEATLMGPDLNARGALQPNSRFSDLPGLVEFIHSLGFKAGIYSSPGALTCGRCWGSLGHEEQDAAQFAEWGFDLLKYDWCAYRYEVSNRTAPPLEELIKPYEIMAKALRAQPRDIVFSLCQYGTGEVWKWGPRIGGNYWRTTRDITDTWGSMSGIAFMQNGREAYARPGQWNDLDMLMVGQIWWGANRRATRLTPDEQYTQVSMWSLQAAPLLLSCDLTRLDDFTKALLTNPEVIAVDQDSVGQAARRIWHRRNLEVWSRPLADGSLAVGFFNRGELAAEIAVDWTQLGLNGPAHVRDLWRQEDLGGFPAGFSDTVPRHGVKLIKVLPDPMPRAALRKTDVYVGGQDGYHTYRIPVMVTSKKGTLLAFAEARKDNDRDTGDIDLVVKRSFDGGATWQPMQLIHDEPGKISVHNAVATADRDTGAIHLVYVCDARRVYYVRSDDDGATLSAPVEITGVVREMYARAGLDWTTVHTGPGHGLQMRSGRLIVPIKTTGKHGRVSRRVAALYSDDHGATWKGGDIISPEIGELSETTAIERDNGELVFNMRWHDGIYRAVCVSPDGGLTWSKPVPALQLPDQVCQASEIRCSEASGDTRVLFSNLPPPFLGFSKRAGLVVRFSPDDARTWTKELVIEPGYSGYSDLAIARDGQALLLYENGTKIYSDKITLAWLPAEFFAR